MTELKINGMHCQACVSLIQMELEDNELDQSIEKIELLEDNTGRVILKEAVNSELEQKIAKVINSMPNYQVI